MHPSVLDLWKYRRRCELAARSCNTFCQCECGSAGGLHLRSRKNLPQRAFGGADAVAFRGVDNPQPRRFSNLLDPLPAFAIPGFSFCRLEFCASSCNPASSSVGNTGSPPIRYTRRGARELLSPLGRLECGITFHFASMDVNGAIGVPWTLVPFSVSTGSKRSKTGAQRRFVLMTEAFSKAQITEHPFREPRSVQYFWPAGMTGVASSSNWSSQFEVPPT